MLPYIAGLLRLVPLFWDRKWTLAHMPKQHQRPRALETHTGRDKLEVRGKPHWLLRLSRGLTLGYRRCEGPGSWSVRVIDGDTRSIKRIGLADDMEPADGKRVLSFDQACAVARRFVQADTDAGSKPITLDDALTSYEGDLRARDANPYKARWARKHLTPALLSRPLQMLTGAELLRWRNGLIARGMKAATFNRLRNSLRAALELCSEDRTHVWKAGLERLPDTRKQRARNVVLPDKDVLALVGASYRLDRGFGLLMDVLAGTGARSSQVERLLVEDLHADDASPKLMMPRSGKGGGRNRSERKQHRFPVPISAGLALRLKAAAEDRADDEPLLLQTYGKPWTANANPSAYYCIRVRKAVAAIGHDPRRVTAYAFRHSSITRMLLKGVPITIVAKLHDTSVGEIEKHYAAFIADHADALARGALLEAGTIIAFPKAS